MNLDFRNDTFSSECMAYFFLLILQKPFAHQKAGEYLLQSLTSEGEELAIIMLVPGVD